MLYHRHLSTNKYFMKYAEIEKCATLMYTHFTEKEIHNSTLQNLWAKLSAEKREHVTQIELLRFTVCKHSMENRKIEDELIIELSQKAQQRLNEVYIIAYEPITALTLSESFESWLQDLHAKQNICFSNDNLNGLFQFIDMAAFIGPLHHRWSGHFNVHVMQKGGLSTLSQEDS